MVDLKKAKDYLRIDYEEDDEFIRSLIAASKIYLENACGKFKSNELKKQDGEKIQPTYGHGIEYYRRSITWSFSEMIANYSEIVKSKNPTEGIEILKKYVGEELVEFIQEYYDKQILNSKKYITEEQKIM